MAKTYHFRNLILWQRAQELAHDVIQLTKRLPQNWAHAVIARQIIASATSIGANIAEGHGRFSPGAHRNHLSIARGSTAETDSWLDLLRRQGVLSTEEEEQLHNRCDQLIAMLTTKMNLLEADSLDSDRRTKEERENYILPGVNYPTPPYEVDDYLEQ